MTAEPSSSPLSKHSLLSKLKNLTGKDEQLPTRPTLGFKSRSSNSVRPSDLHSSQEKLKQQRDSFLQSRQQDFTGDSKVFGVPLEQSLEVAEGRIYISGNDGLVRYGRIPIVVALCGLYLKKEGLEVEGIFRIGGSSKRIKQLQIIFSTPPEYGRKIDWVGYTVHDAASLLRRFLGSLPEPLVPFEMYEKFREPLRQRPRICKYLKSRNKPRSPDAAAKPKEQEQEPKEQEPKEVELKDTETTVSEEKSEESCETEAAPSTEPVAITETTDTTAPEEPAEPAEPVKAAGASEQSIEAPQITVSEEADSDKKKASKRKHEKFLAERNSALEEYARLIDELPDLSRHLLFYILDLLALFNYHSEKNLMPARNLAAIFQPSILSHSDHDMAPEEYELSRLVIEFMTQYSYKLLPAAQNLTLKSSFPTADTPRTPPTAESKQKTSYPPVSASNIYSRKHSKSLPSVTQPPDIIDVNLKKTSISSGSFNNGSNVQLNSQAEITESEVSDDEPQLASPPQNGSDPFLSPKVSSSPQAKGGFLRRRRGDSVTQDDEAVGSHSFGTRLLGFLSPNHSRERSSSIDEVVRAGMSPKRKFFGGSDLSPTTSPTMKLSSSPQ